MKRKRDGREGRLTAARRSSRDQRACNGGWVACVRCVGGQPAEGAENKTKRAAMLSYFTGRPVRQSQARSAASAR